MRRIVLGSTALVIGVAAAMAQANDPIAARRNLMKGNGAAAKTGTQMVKGEIPFDLAKAKEILQVFATTADKAHNYFPETSKTGGETTASPKIWESQAEFRARFDEWARDIQKATAQTKDLETFKTEFTTVTKACGACHQTYRIKT